MRVDVCAAIGARHSSDLGSGYGQMSGWRKSPHDTWARPGCGVVTQGRRRRLPSRYTESVRQRQAHNDTALTCVHSVCTCSFSVRTHVCSTEHTTHFGRGVSNQTRFYFATTGNDDSKSRIENISLSLSMMSASGLVGLASRLTVGGFQIAYFCALNIFECMNVGSVFTP